MAKKMSNQKMLIIGIVVVAIFGWIVLLQKGKF